MFQHIHIRRNRRTFTYACICIYTIHTRTCNQIVALDKILQIFCHAIIPWGLIPIKIISGNFSWYRQLFSFATSRGVIAGWIKCNLCIPIHVRSKFSGNRFLLLFNCRLILLYKPPRCRLFQHNTFRQLHGLLGVIEANYTPPRK